MPYALITGASKGIGKAIAEELAARKWDLILVSRSADLLKSLSEDLVSRYQIAAPYLAIDLASEQASQQIFTWCQSHQYVIHALINNAGYGLSGSLDQYTLNDHLSMMRVNMQVPVELCLLLLPQLKAQKKAYILNIASSAAYQAVPGLTIYAASKAFVLSFSRGLQKELRKTNVLVTCISPGSTDTQFVDRAGINEKARKLAEKVNMTPQAVAHTSIEAMLAGKSEVIPGFINKLGAFMVWILPKNVVENAALKIYQL